MLDRIALILVVIGAINWGAIGLFQFDLVAWIFGGQDAIISRIVYTLVALAGIWCISLLFRRNEMLATNDEMQILKKRRPYKTKQINKGVLQNKKCMNPLKIIHK